MTEETSGLIEDVKRLAQIAGREIAAIYRGTAWGVTAKPDESPLTLADLRANDIILEGLAKISSDLIISEEGAKAFAHWGRETALPARFWLVDPLDGTRDFVAKLDTFVVCIALIENGAPILGVIHSPVTDELWWAEAGKGAFGPDGRRLMNTRLETKDLIATGSRSQASDRMNLLYERFQVGHVERFGSALKFCKLAEGRFDLYPRFGPTMEWDTAAGQIIAEEAGCKVIDLQTTERLKYGKPGLENRGFLCTRANLNLESGLAALRAEAAARFPAG